MTDLRARPRVSVIVPCRNEAAFIERAIQSVLASDYPAELIQVVVADGMSDDGTRGILANIRSRDPRLVIVDNPDGTIPGALNLAVGAATGDVIMRLDAHAEIGPRYLPGCIEHLTREGVARVGGKLRTLPQHGTPMGRAIAAVLSSPLGVGGSRFRTATDDAPMEVDTVPFWAAWRRVLDEVGPYDPRIERSEDIVHSRALLARGHKTLLVPSLVATYYARSSWTEFAAHAYLNGRWVILPSRHMRGLGVSPRHLVPLAFVSALLVMSIAAFFSPFAALALAAAAGVYALVALVGGGLLAARRHDAGLAFLVPIVLATLHVAYGLGSLREALRPSRRR